jgi:hypothetical protein
MVPRAPRSNVSTYFHDHDGDDDGNKVTRCSLKKSDDPLGPDTVYNVSAVSSLS